MPYATRSMASAAASIPCLDCRISMFRRDGRYMEKPAPTFW